MRETQSAKIGTLVSATIDNDGVASLNGLMPNNRRHVPARLSDQVPTQFKDESSVRCAGRERFKLVCNRHQLQFRFIR